MGQSVTHMSRSQRARDTLVTNSTSSLPICHEPGSKWICRLSDDKTYRDSIKHTQTCNKHKNLTEIQSNTHNYANKHKDYNFTETISSSHKSSQPISSIYNLIFTILFSYLPIVWLHFSYVVHAFSQRLFHNFFTSPHLPKEISSLTIVHVFSIYIQNPVTH